MAVDLSDFREHKTLLTQAYPEWEKLSRPFQRIGLFLFFFSLFGLLPDHVLSNSIFGSLSQTKHFMGLLFGLALFIVASSGCVEAILTMKINKTREANNQPAFEYIKAKVPPYITLTTDYAHARKRCKRQFLSGVIIALLGLFIIWINI